MSRRKMSKTCEQCGTVYERNRKFGKAQWEASKFCGRDCSGRANAVRLADSRPTLREKFDALFTKGDGCWPWEGTIDGYGYGVIDHGGKRYRAHVLALEFDGRPVPAGMLGCHHCDNPPCVNPDHLYPGTHKDNAQDAIARGRKPIGERSALSKLTDADVIEMRQIVGMTTKAIADLYGVSRPTAAKAIKGQSWRHIP